MKDTLLTGKDYRPSYATDIAKTIKRELRRLAEEQKLRVQEKERESEDRAEAARKVKPLIRSKA